jgi:hypothetical protein
VTDVGDVQHDRFTAGFHADGRMEMKPCFASVKGPAQLINDPERGSPKLPRAGVERVTAQAAITVVCTSDAGPIRRDLNRETERARASTHTKTAPDLRRILAVHCDGIVRSRAALPVPLGPHAINRGSAVYEHTLPRERKLE